MTEFVCSHHLVFVELCNLNLSGSMLQQFTTFDIQTDKNAVNFLIARVLFVSHLQYKQQFINIAVTSTAKLDYLSL